MGSVLNSTTFSVLVLLTFSLFFTSKQSSIHAQELHNAVKALVAPIKKTNSSVYTTSLKINSNQNQQLIVDLSSPVLSFPCCWFSNPNGIQTNVTINSTNGRNPTGDVTLQSFNTSCNETSVAGLARSPQSLSSQLISKLSLKNQFGICMPDSLSPQGVIFFGSEPYEIMWPYYPVDLSKVITYLPLVIHPEDGSYMLTLTGLALNYTQILSFKPGTTALLSTTNPYTKLRSDIYHPFVDAFTKATVAYPRVSSVEPFELCFNYGSIPASRVGYYVPLIDLMLDGGKNWTIFGYNTITRASEEALCLGFVDGGMNMEHAVVIGAFQMENNFLLFDEEKSRLGFSSTILFMRANCGGFNFTSV
ncbi:hypothetical protein LUZ61_020915 [Rhynchospora tenuis]|uniref:Peptidase A1 domain-containing protein n=1 Tax=Rhynchospora tenuis TaxID=198213 RepID=A0AAD5ZDW2_9POAL|nr:hypothetical protein LUZ61_020915 [Rhynchospora tenuis]